MFLVQNATPKCQNIVITVKLYNKWIFIDIPRPLLLLDGEFRRLFLLFCHINKISRSGINSLACFDFNIGKQEPQQQWQQQLQQTSQQSLSQSLSSFSPYILSFIQLDFQIIIIIMQIVDTLPLIVVSNFIQQPYFFFVDFLLFDFLSAFSFHTKGQS